MTPKRLGILIGVLALVAAGALWLWRRAPVATTADGPIVIFSIDTLRADRLPAYGYTKIRTPNIDALAADGVLFEHAYAHSPQTLPSHTSLLSGTLPFEHGVRDNIGFSVKPNQRFLQHALKERGYATAGFVSAYVLREQTGFNQGFDVYDDELPPAGPDRPLGQVQRPGADTVAAATRWIDRQAGSKLFLFVHIYEPHRPYTPPQRFAAESPYDGEVQHADEIVGQLIAHLKAKNLYDRSTFVLLSDHGEGLGDHGEDEHGIFLYRETIQVPLIVKLPGGAQRGRRVSAAVQHIDIPPTLLDLSGALAPRPPGPLAGRSLRAAIEGTGALPNANIYAEALSPRYHFGWSELYALSDDRYRFIRAPRDELYDIQQDPKELKSIADERAQVRAAMRGALESMIANASLEAPSTVSNEDRQKLAALGYVGTQSGASLKLPGDKLPDPKDKIGVLQKYKRASDLAGERRFVEATALYREVVSENPEMTDVWLQLAEIYGRRGMPAESVAAFKEVVKRNPKDPAGLTGAAAGLLRLRQFDEAKAHAELATDVAPATAHELLARIAIERGDADAARRHAQLASGADATLPIGPFVEGVLLHRGNQFAAAIPHFEEAARRTAARTVQMADVHYYLGDSLARAERYQEAERAFRTELAASPAHVRARAGLAMLYRVTGRTAESDQAIADLIRNSPTPEGYDVAAQLWTMFGEPAKAAEIRAKQRQIPR